MSKWESEGRGRTDLCRHTQVWEDEVGPRLLCLQNTCVTVKRKLRHERSYEDASSLCFRCQLASEKEQTCNLPRIPGGCDKRHAVSPVRGPGTRNQLCGPQDRGRSNYNIESRSKTTFLGAVCMHTQPRQDVFFPLTQTTQGRNSRLKTCHFSIIQMSACTAPWKNTNRADTREMQYRLPGWLGTEPKSVLAGAEFKVTEPAGPQLIFVTTQVSLHSAPVLQALKGV